MKTYYKKTLLILISIALFSSCSKEDNPINTENVNFTIYKNQLDDLNANALEAQFIAADNSHTINLYGLYDGENRNPNIITTLTYQKTNNDTLVNIIIDLADEKISSLFLTVNGVKSNIVMKFDYSDNSNLDVSFHQYDWDTTVSQNIYSTRVASNGLGNKNAVNPKRDGPGNDFDYHLSVLETEFVAIGATAQIGNGWSGITALSAPPAEFTAGISATAIAGADAIEATIQFLKAVNPLNNRASDKIPPANIILNNPVPPSIDPKYNLQLTSCSNNNITFEGSMDAFGSILISAVSGGSAPYTYLVSSQLQASAVFPNQYPDGSYVLGVKDANGCMSVKAIPLDRAIDNINGTWRLNSSIIESDNNLEIITSCTATNTLELKTNGTYIHKYYKLFNNSCDLEASVNGSYVVNNNTINFTKDAVGQPYSSEIVSVTESSLRLRTTDNQGVYLDIYTKQ